MAEVDAQCSSQGWRSTPMASNPTPNEEFAFTTAEYYTKVVLGATWPAILGLAAFAGLLLSYLLWRLVIMCAGCCRRRRGRKLSTAPPAGRRTRRRPSRAAQHPLLGRSATVMRASIGALFFGVAVGCIYGMVMVNSQLVDQALGTINAVEAYAENVLGALERSVDAAGAIDAALEDIQGLVEGTVNATDIAAQLNCLRPLLQDLPNPTVIETDLQEATDGIAGLTPLLEQVNGNLSALAVENPPGTWSGALVDLTDAKPVLEDFASQGEAFSVATAALTLPGDTPAATLAARDALDALLNDPPYATKVASINTTIAALQAIEMAVIGADDALTAALAAAQALLDGPAAALAATMAALDADYAAARPCMVALQTRAAAIQESVMALPPGLSASINTLNATQTGLDAVLEPENDPTTSQRLTQTLALANQQVDGAGALAAQVTAARTSLEASADFAALVAALESVRDTVAPAETSLRNLLDQTNAYIAGPVAPGSYFPLAVTLKGAGTTVGLGASGLSSWLASAAPLYAQAADVFADLSSSNSAAELTQLQEQLAALPAAELLAGPVADYETQYAALPSPRTALVDSAIAAVNSVVNDVQNAVGGARGVLGGAVDGADAALDTVRQDGLSRIDSYVSDYEDDVRKYDSYRQAALYVLFASALALDLAVLGGAAALWPAALKTGSLLLMVLFTVEFALVVALTAGLKVGTDGCANVEAQVLQRVDQPSRAATLARYYFYGEGASAASVLYDVFDLDVESALEQVASARGELQAGVATLALRGAMATAVDEAVAGSFSIAAAITETLYLLDYQQVNPLYVLVKQYPCCTVLDMGGGVWTGIIIAGCCVFAQIIVSMVLIGRFDRLPAPQGCCRWYAGKSGQEALLQADQEAFPSTGDSEEGEAGGDGSGGTGEENASPTKAPRQSKLFRLFHKDSAVDVAGHQGPSIDVVADTRSDAASAAVAAALAAEAGRRRSSAPPPPSAPPAPGY